MSHRSVSHHLEDRVRHMISSTHASRRKVLNIRLVLLERSKRNGNTKAEEEAKELKQGELAASAVAPSRRSSDCLDAQPEEDVRNERARLVVQYYMVNWLDCTPTINSRIFS